MKFTVYRVFLFTILVLITPSLTSEPEDKPVADKLTFDQVGAYSLQKSPSYSSYGPYYPKPPSKTGHGGEATFSGFTGVIAIIAMAAFIIAAVVLVFSGGAFFTFSTSSLYGRENGKSDNIFSSASQYLETIRHNFDINTFMTIMKSLQEITHS